jgi:hypothetical protein
MMHIQAINLFGAGVAMVGLGGVATAIEAARQSLALRGTGCLLVDLAIAGAMLATILAGLVTVVLGTSVALLDTGLAGGANG